MRQYRGHFNCLVDYLKKQGKLVKVIVPDEKRYSSLLLRFIPDSAYMNGLRNKLEYRK